MMVEEMRIGHLLAINWKMHMIDNRYSLEKEFIELISMNP